MPIWLLRATLGEPNHQSSDVQGTVVGTTVIDCGKIFELRSHIISHGQVPKYLLTLFVIS